jgi:hypothetical protein
MAGEKTQDFPLGAVLSVTTGMLMCDFGEVGDLLEFMANEPVWTHQLPRVADEARPVILRQHPMLADIETPDIDKTQDVKAQITAFLEETSKTYGTTLPITAMHAEEHEPKGPLTELVEKLDQARDKG